VTEHEQGHHEAAKHYGEIALAAGRQLGDRVIISLCLLNLANAMIALGDLAGARLRLEETIAMQRQQGDSESLAPPLNTLGRMLLQLGDLTGARALLSEALHLRVQAGDRRGIAVSLETFARLEMEAGRLALATRLFAAASAQRAAIGAPQVPARRAEQEQLLDEIRSRLGAAEYEAAWGEGRGVKLEELVSQALDRSLQPA
jgi:hypothetical protein